VANNPDDTKLWQPSTGSHKLAECATGEGILQAAQRASQLSHVCPQLAGLQIDFLRNYIGKTSRKIDPTACSKSSAHSNSRTCTVTVRLAGTVVAQSPHQAAAPGQVVRAVSPLALATAAKASRAAAPILTTNAL
jgi:hypothetical protein